MTQISVIIVTGILATITSTTADIKKVIATRIAPIILVLGSTNNIPPRRAGNRQAKNKT